VDDHDADGLTVADAAEVHRLAVEHDLAVVAAGRVHAGQHLHEGGLAGAVLPADGVDLPAPDVERHVRERRHTGKSLGDAAHLEQYVVHPSSFVIDQAAGPGGHSAGPGPVSYLAWPAATSSAV
jgi:hypothetical protein